MVGAAGGQAGTRRPCGGGHWPGHSHRPAIEPAGHQPIVTPTSQPPGDSQGAAPGPCASGCCAAHLHDRSKADVTDRQHPPSRLVGRKRCLVEHPLRRPRPARRRRHRNRQRYDRSLFSERARLLKDDYAIDREVTLIDRDGLTRQPHHSFYACRAIGQPRDPAFPAVWPPRVMGEW